jgi:hypothetical protein
MEMNNIFLGQGTLQPTFDMNSTFRFLIGTYNNATNNGEILLLNGGICEMVFSDSDDSTFILKNEAYLRYKYAPAVDLGKDTLLTSFCTYTINGPSGFTNVLWNTGATSNSINITQSGTYWMQGTDRFGYISRDTIIVTYPTIPTITESGICQGSSLTWDADMGPGFTYLWSTGETTPSINISSPGSYSVQVTDAFACSASSNTIPLGIDMYETNAWLGNDTSLCSGNLIGLQIGAPETVSYLWPDASSGTTYLVDTTGNYFLESVNNNGCVAQDTIHITITGTAPNAQFTAANLCKNVTGDFVDTSVPAGMGHG